MPGAGWGGLLSLTLLNKSSKNPEVQIRSAAKSQECATIHIHTGHCHIETCPVIYLLFQLYGSTVLNSSSVANMGAVVRHLECRPDHVHSVTVVF